MIISAFDEATAKQITGAGDGQYGEGIQSPFFTANLTVNYKAGVKILQTHIIEVWTEEVKQLSGGRQKLVFASEMTSPDGLVTNTCSATFITAPGMAQMLKDEKQPYGLEAATPELALLVD